MKEIRKEPKEKKVPRSRRPSRPGGRRREPGAPDRASAGWTAGEVTKWPEILERSFRELVRYYRHSAAGRRCRGIVHQMNTPLQVASLLLELLEQKNREEQKALPQSLPPVAQQLEMLIEYRAKKLSQFRQEMGKLHSLTRNLLRQGAHEEQEEPLYLDLNEVYRQELELYLALPFFNYRVEKNFRFSPGLPPIYGYYIDFSQSFRNLIDNALEAMEGVVHPVLTVETDFEENRRVLRIGDNGVGIPAPHLSRIFEPYFTTKGSDRAGLGLFMARRLLAPYQGEIQVESRPGETWVTVYLPVV